MDTCRVSAPRGDGWGAGGGWRGVAWVVAWRGVGECVVCVCAVLRCCRAVFLTKVRDMSNATGDTATSVVESASGGIVCEWLERIGLGYAVDSFKEKGVNSPQALIGLTFQDYDDLKITALADRKRLFELVQRVRMAARAVKRNASDETAAQDTEDTGRARKSSSKSPNRSRAKKENPATTHVESDENQRSPESAKILQPQKSVGVEVSNRGGTLGRDRDSTEANASSKSKTRASNNTFAPAKQNQDVSDPRPRTADVAPNRNSGKAKHESVRHSTDGNGRLQARNRRSVGGGSPSKRPNAFESVYKAPVRTVAAPGLSRPTTSETRRSSASSRSDFSSRIRVVVRKRPMSRSEKNRGDVDVIEMHEGELILHEPKVKVDMTRYVESHAFTFDSAFDEKAGNVDIYDQTCKPLVSAVFDGAKATCFAYGQTGSGKTYTMMGPDADGRQRSAHTPGLYELAARDMFERMTTPAYEHLEMSVSFFEIYGGKLFDLLNERRRLQCLEDGKKHANIVGLRKVAIQNVEELFELMERGHEARSTGTTGANLDSSRSHAVLQIVLKDGQSGKGQGKISFIDLAGSERGQDTTHADRQTRMEGAEINKSLLALKECIRALYHEQDHTPFRGSKLTQVLKDSFTGNGRTVMVVTISPNMGNCEHTLNTLRYGYRVKELGNDNSSASRRSSGGGLDLNRDFGSRQSSKLAVANAFGGKGRSAAIRRDIANKHDDGAKTGDADRSTSRKSNGSNILLPPKKSKAPARTGGRLSNGGRPSAEFKNHAAAQQQSSPVEKSAAPPAPHAAPTLPIQPPDTLDEPFVPAPSHSSPKARVSPPVPQSAPETGAAINELDLSQEHQELVSTILSDEETLVASHREHIHTMMNLVKQEMAILNRVDIPGAKIDQYASELGTVLDQKLNHIIGLKSKLDKFLKKLEQEENLHSSMNSSMSSTSSPLHR